MGLYICPDITAGEKGVIHAVQMGGDHQGIRRTPAHRENAIIWPLYFASPKPSSTSFHFIGHAT